MSQLLSSSAIGARLEGAARAALPVLVFVYTLGLTAGEWYRSTTAAVAAAHARWIGDAWRFDQPAHAPAAQPQPPAAKPQAPRITATRHTAPLTVEALVAAHTQRELMVMAGTKSKRSKKQLAERILKTK